MRINGWSNVTGSSKRGEDKPARSHRSAWSLTPARALRGAVFGWLAMCMAVGCEHDLKGQTAERPDTPAHSPNILLISIDTLRADHLGCYGYTKDTSPNIDRLARDGTRFTKMTSTCSWTLPSHASMLTGLYPAHHALENDGVQLPREIPTLAEALQHRGYYTVGVVSHLYVSSAFGLQRGFDVFDETLIEGGKTNPLAEQVVDRVLELMRAAPRERFFAFVHFFDPHWDYTPPAPYNRKFTDPDYRGRVNGQLTSLLPYRDGRVPMPEADRRQAIALYDGEIAYTDAQIGRLLDALREEERLENTVIVLTADHGEEFLEHNRLGHGRRLYREQLHVPLIICGHAQFPPGSVRNDLVSLVDIAPTLLALTGSVDGLDGCEGVSLCGATSAPSAVAQPEAGRIVFAESIRFGYEMRAARDARFKLIHYKQGDVRHHFDLDADPQEQQPLLKDPTGGRLTTTLDQYASEADRGWHLKLINPRRTALHCRATVRTEGQFIDPRRYFSGNTSPPADVEFTTFKLSERETVLTVDLEVTRTMSEIAFQTEPANAPITCKVSTTGPASAGVFLGSGLPVSAAKGITLTPGDPRVHGFPSIYAQAVPGCYIHAVAGPTTTESQLSREALERLRSLGYVDTEDEADD